LCTVEEYKTPNIQQVVLTQVRIQSQKLKHSSYLLAAFHTLREEETTMHLTTLLYLAAFASAVPTGSDPFHYLTVSLVFQGGPASYTLDILADGNTYYTSS